MTLEDTLTALHNTGLTHPEAEVPQLTDEPKVAEYLCQPSGDAAARYFTEGASGLGYHPDDTLARVKSAAECLERLCLLNPAQAPEPEAAYREVPGACDPACFLTEPPTDAAARQRARDSRYGWWTAVDHAANQQRFMPAQMVFLKPFPEEFQLRREHSSSGAALGVRGTERALSSGIFEGVERDAAIAAYLTRAPLPRITGLPPETLELVSYLRRYRLEPYVFDARSGLGIPAVVAVTIDETGVGPAVNVGLRASFSYQDAITGALLESLQARRAIRLSELPSRFPEANEVTSLEQRFYFWHPTERIELLHFWLKTDRKVAYESLAADPLTLNQVVDRLREVDHHVLVADVTLPEIANNGFEVLKVVIPELHPLYLDERAKTLYSVRHGAIGEDSSLAPHPFV